MGGTEGSTEMKYFPMVEIKLKNNSQFWFQSNFGIHTPTLDDRRGQGNGNRDRQNRQDDRNERSLRYSIRDIPTFDGKGDAMPHTHLIEFEDFLLNTASEIH